MDIREFTRAYLRSPLGICSFLVADGVVLALRLAGLPLAAAILLGVAALAASFGLSLGLGFGQRAASSELEREARTRAESRLVGAEGARKRLAAIRLSSPEVAGARDLVVLEAGRLVEDCRRAGSYDPAAVEAVLDSLGLVDAWLKEADESAIEKRFDLPDADPFPEAAARTAQALREKARVISAGRVAASGEIPAADRIAIDEELK